MTDSLDITLWNVQWAKAKRAQFVKGRLLQCPADVLCVTEGYPDMLKDSGHLISSDADHGYNTTDDRRKVMLWSKNPWSSVDTGNGLDFPSGRFVSGITDTPLGSIRFVGVCIPWKSAHVSTGRRDREVWQDHMMRSKNGSTQRTPQSQLFCLETSTSAYPTADNQNPLTTV